MYGTAGSGLKVTRRLSVSPVLDCLLSGEDSQPVSCFALARWPPAAPG